MNNGGSTMTRSIRAAMSVLVAAMLVFLSPLSRAQNVGEVLLIGTSQGSPAHAYFWFDHTRPATLSDVLPDGRQHHRFDLSGDEGYGDMWGFTVQGEHFQGLSQGSGGPLIDSYLLPDGSSALTLSWAVSGGHAAADINLQLFSPVGDLFFATLNRDLFKVQATGVVRLQEDIYDPLEGQHYLRDRTFALSVVPEPVSGLLMLAGVFVVAAVQARRWSSARLIR